MRYEKPVMEIMILEMNEIVTLSAEGAGSGGVVDEETGGWG